MNPYVFIVGCPRSGTTLLTRIVDAHPDIAMTPEHVVDWFGEELHHDPDGRVQAKADDDILYEMLPKLKLDAQEVRLLQNRNVSNRRFATEVFELCGRNVGKPLVGNKTTRYVLEIRRLHALFPRARFVHLVRDGRDVCLSLLGWQRKAAEFEKRFSTWRSDPLVTAALHWERLVSIGREDGGALPPGLYHEIRYEDLISSPESACRRLCAFLDIEYDERMPRFHEGRTKTQPALSAKRAWLPITSGLRDWRTQLPHRDVEAFEAAAGGLLDELGYERAAPTPSDEARARVARVAAMCRDELAQRPTSPVGVA